MPYVSESERTRLIEVRRRIHAHPELAYEEQATARLVSERLRELGLRRLFLHAASLQFEWPDRRERVRIEAPLPEDLAAVLGKLNDQTL